MKSERFATYSPSSKGEPVKLTRETYNEAKGKIEKLKAKAAEAQTVVKNWEDAEKTNPAPTGYEITAFLNEDGVWNPVMRKIPEPKKSA